MPVLIITFRYEDASRMTQYRLVNSRLERGFSYIFMIHAVKECFIIIIIIYHIYAGHLQLCAVGSKSFRPDIQNPRQMENAVRDI